MDSEGNLSTDCKMYGSIEEAKTAQADLNNSFKELVNQSPEYIIFEETGTFIRLAIKNSLSEIQSHIEVFEC
ncbi:MAG: hypothetical protein J6A27_07850 [Bacteroidales bacterium]|nr:hypothetical protein [Bacteroidales bacterium]